METVRKATSCVPAWGLAIGLILGLPAASAHGDEPRAVTQREKPAKQAKAQSTAPGNPAPAKEKRERGRTQAGPRAVQKAQTNPVSTAQQKRTDRSAEVAGNAKGKPSDATLATRTPPAPLKQLDTRNAPAPVTRAGAGNGVGKPEDVKSPRVHLPPPTTVDLPAPPTPETATDRDLRERLQATIFEQRDLPYSARLVGVSVKNGVITLHGQVNTDYERMRVGEVVDQMRGDYGLKNQILVRNQFRLSTRPPGLLDPGPAQASRTR